MPGELLGAAGHGEVGAEFQRALAERRREGVVDGDEGALRVCGLGEPPDVAHVQARVRRASRSTAASRRRGRRAGRRRRSARCAPRCRTPPAARAPGAAPGSRRRAGRPRPRRAAGRRAPTRWRPCRRRTRASRRRPPGRLQLADGALQEGPGGVLVAAVGVRAGGLARQMEVGGEHRAGQGRFVLDRLGQPGPHRAGAVARTVESRSAHVPVVALMPPVPPPVSRYRGEQTGARRLHHLKALLEAVHAPVVGVRDVEIVAGGGVVRAQQPDLRRVRGGGREAAQGLEVAGVEGDDEVEAGEPGRPGTAGPRGRCRSRRLQHGDGARVGAVALVPAARAGAVDLDQAVQPGLRHARAEDGLGHRRAADVAGADEADAVGHRVLSPRRAGRRAAPRRRSR